MESGAGNMATRRKKEKKTKVEDLPDVVPRVNVKGRCIGVQLEQRGLNDNHIMFRLLVEDDEVWYPQDFCVSSAWLDETIVVLTTMREMIQRTGVPDMHNGRQYGFNFKR